MSCRKSSRTQAAFNAMLGHFPPPPPPPSLYVRTCQPVAMRGDVAALVIRLHAEQHGRTRSGTPRSLIRPTGKSDLKLRIFRAGGRASDQACAIGAAAGVNRRRGARTATRSGSTRNTCAFPSLPRSVKRRTCRVSFGGGSRGQNTACNREETDPGRPHEKKKKNQWPPSSVHRRRSVPYVHSDRWTMGAYSNQPGGIAIESRHGRRDGRTAASEEAVDLGERHGDRMVVDGDDGSRSVHHGAERRIIHMQVATMPLYARSEGMARVASILLGIG